MSDAVRSYSQGGSTGPSRARGLFQGGLRATRFLMAFALIGALYTFWIARDTHDIHEFVPTETQYLITAHDLVQHRERFVNAPAWKALPDTWKTHPIFTLINAPIETQDWVLRNMLGRRFLLYGHDSLAFSDALYIARMTAVGTVLERNFRRASGNTYETAGGLNLRYLEDYKLYYAVRGRYLLASASRTALIQALTLEPTKALGEQGWDPALWPAGDEDFRGTIHLAPPQEETYFTAIGFAARLESEQAFLKMMIPYTPSFQQTFNLDALSSVRPTFIEAIPGPITLSTNLEIPLSEIGTTLFDIPGASFLIQPSWLSPEVADSADRAQVLTHEIFSGATGAMALTWHGFELNDIVPTSTYSVVGQYKGDTLQNAIDSIEVPATPESFRPTQVHFDAESSFLTIASIGSQSMTAVFHELNTPSQQHLLFSTSLTQAQEDWPSYPTLRHRSETGHLYLHIDAPQLLNAYRDYGTHMAESGLLSGHTPSSLQESILEIESKVASLHDLTLQAHHFPSDRALEIDIRAYYKKTTP